MPVSDAPVGRDFMAELDGAGQYQVDAFLDEIETIAAHLERTARDIRGRAQRVCIEALNGTLVTSSGEAVLPSVAIHDLLPDMGGITERILHDYCTMVGNLRLDTLAQKGRDAHEAFRRASRDRG